MIRNPETIIIKNKFYPNGLKEIDIYNYYMNNKQQILSRIEYRDVFFYLFNKTNNYIIKRRLDKNRYIHLDNKNYENIITGRTVSIISCLNKYEDFGIIDIDCSNFKQAKKACEKVYDYVSKLNKIFKSVEIRYTGGTGFHIVCYFKFKRDINEIRFLLKKILTDKFNKVYDVKHGRRVGKVNLDITINKFRGGFITLGSLSKNGLVCSKINRKKLNLVGQDKFKIK